MDDATDVDVLEYFGVKAHRLQIGPFMRSWLALLTETSFTLHPVPGKPGLYERRGIRA